MRNDVEKMKLAKITENEFLTYVKNLLNIDLNSNVNDVKQVSTRSKNNLNEIETIYHNVNNIERGTIYGAYNAYTDYFSHKKTFKGSEEDKTESILFGAGSMELEKSYNLALAMSN